MSEVLASAGLRAVFRLRFRKGLACSFDWANEFRHLFLLFRDGVSRILWRWCLACNQIKLELKDDCSVAGLGCNKS